MTKTRLDALLAGRGMTPSRERAKALILAGAVFVNGNKAVKAGEMVADDAEIEIRGEPLPFVSRGGLKLKKALTLYPLDLNGAVCVDIGASTGGFTDCMLQHGASRVYAVDVGYDQLDPKLRADPRVINLERTNIRYVTAEQIPEPLDFGSVDVSFISLTLVLPVLSRLLKEGGSGVCLVKPQFEAGKGKVGKKGVVRDPGTHLDVLRRIFRFCGEVGLSVKGIDFSPIKGPEGNIEYLFCFAKSPEPSGFSDLDLINLVGRSHQVLDRKDDTTNGSDLPY